VSRSRPKARRKRGGQAHGPGERSVALSVHQGVARQLEAARVELGEARRQLFAIRSLLVATVAKVGGIIDVDYVTGEHGLQYEERPGGVVLILTDGAGRQGGNDADENRMDRRDLEPHHGLQ